MRRLWGMSIWIVAAVALLTASARAQNLDAGKPPAQLYSEVCAACHKSARELKRPSAAFLRQHYTTSSEAATAIAGYLAGVPSDPRAAQPKRPPAGSSPTAPAATANAAATAETPPEANRRTLPERDQAKQTPSQPQGALPKGKRPPAGATAEAAGKPAAELSPPPPPEPRPAAAAPAPVLEPFYE